MWGANPDTRCFKKIEYYRLTLRPRSIIIPYLVKDFKMDKFIDLHLGSQHSVALCSDGIIYMAGNPEYG